MELESDTQKCSQNFCLLRLSFYLRFSLCDKFTVSGWLPPMEPGPPAALMLLSWVSRAERKGHLFASLFYRTRKRLLIIHLELYMPHPCIMGFPRQSKLCLKCRVCGFDPWVRKIPWRREWQPIPVILPGEFHRQRSLVVYSPWGWKESNRIEWLSTSMDKSVQSRNWVAVNSFQLLQPER